MTEACIESSAAAGRGGAGGTRSEVSAWKSWSARRKSRSSVGGGPDGRRSGLRRILARRRHAEGCHSRDLRDRAHGQPLRGEGPRVAGVPRLELLDDALERGSLGQGPRRRRGDEAFVHRTQHRGRSRGPAGRRKGAAGEDSARPKLLAHRPAESRAGQAALAHLGVDRDGASHDLAEDRREDRQGALLGQGSEVLLVRRLARLDGHLDVARPSGSPRGSRRSAARRASCTPPGPPGSPAWPSPPARGIEGRTFSSLTQLL